MLLNRLLKLLLLTHIPLDRTHADHVPGFIYNLGKRQVDGEFLPASRASAHFNAGGHPSRQGLIDQRLIWVIRLHGLKHLNVLAQHLRFGVAINTLSPLVPTYNVPGRIDGDNRIPSKFQFESLDHRLAPFKLAQCAFKGLIHSDEFTVLAFDLLHLAKLLNRRQQDTRGHLQRGHVPRQHLRDHVQKPQGTNDLVLDIDGQDKSGMDILFYTAHIKSTE